MNEKLLKYCRGRVQESQISCAGALICASAKLLQCEKLFKHLICKAFDENFKIQRPSSNLQFQLFNVKMASYRLW